MKFLLEIEPICEIGFDDTPVRETHKDVIEYLTERMKNCKNNFSIIEIDDKQELELRGVDWMAE